MRIPQGHSNLSHGVATERACQPDWFQVLSWRLMALAAGSGAQQLLQVSEVAL